MKDFEPFFGGKEKKLKSGGRHGARNVLDMCVHIGVHAGGEGFILINVLGRMRPAGKGGGSDSDPFAWPSAPCQEVTATQFGFKRVTKSNGGFSDEENRTFRISLCHVLRDAGLRYAEENRIGGSNLLVPGLGRGRYRQQGF